MDMEQQVEVIQKLARELEGIRGFTTISYFG
jgi:hypothetical protein